MVCRVGRENYVGQLLDCLGLREPSRGGRDRGGVRDGGGGGRPEESAGTRGEKGGMLVWFVAVGGFSTAVGGDCSQWELLLE